MDKCCALAIRLTVGIIALLSSLTCFIIAINLHASGSLLSAWNGMADDDKSLYIKIMVIGGLALLYGCASLVHRESNLSAIIPGSIGILIVLACLVIGPRELAVFIATAGIMSFLSFSTLRQTEPVLIHWESHEDEAEALAPALAAAAKAAAKPASSKA